MSTRCSIEYVRIPNGFEHIQAYTECMESENKIYLEHYHNDGEHIKVATFSMSHEMWDAFVAALRKDGEG